MVGFEIHLLFVSSTLREFIMTDQNHQLHSFSTLLYLISSVYGAGPLLQFLSTQQPGNIPRIKVPGYLT